MWIRWRRGLALPVTLLFMMMLSMLATAIYQLVPQEIRLASKDKLDSEAHYALTACLKNATLWLQACQTSGQGLTTHYNYLGDTWNSGTKSFGSFSFNRQSNDPFSCPANDPTFISTTLNDVSCPYNKLGSGLGYLGLQAQKNLSSDDFSAVQAQAGDWPVLQLRNPLQIGVTEVRLFVIPDGATRDGLKFPAGTLRRNYLLVAVAYQSGYPSLRARALFREDTLAKFAWYMDRIGLDGGGNKMKITVFDPNAVVVDGPFHTNEAPVLDVAASYWGSVSSQRAFKGVVSYAGAQNVTAGLDYDNGLAWVGGNFNGNSQSRRPFDSAGNPIVESSGLNRYERLIEGGRVNLRKISALSLPTSLSGIQQAAFGSTATNVSEAQTQGATANATVTLPVRRQSNGAPYSNSGSSIDMLAKARQGAFVNPKPGGSETSGGIAIRGDARSLTLEVLDSGGNIVTDVAALEAGSIGGNPSMRVQSTELCYDPNKTQSYDNYVANGTTTQPTYGPAPAIACVHNVTVWVPGSGSGSGTSSSGSWQPIGPPQHPNDWGSAPVTGNTTVTNYSYAPVAGPLSFRPVDWVVDCQTAMNVTPTMVRSGAAWARGVGGGLSSGSHSEARRDVPNLNISRVYLHDNNSSTGTLVTSTQQIPAGKVAVFKQNRTDSERLDVFLLDRPAGQAQALNGAVFATGNIEGLRGVNKDRRTIAVDSAASKSIRITDNLWQYGTERGQKPSNALHGLGLAADEINIKSDTTRWWNLRNSSSLAAKDRFLHIYAAIIAGRSGSNRGFAVSEAGSGGMDAGSCPGARVPLYKLFGGVIEATGQFRLAFNSSGQQCGWEQQHSFDPELGQYPPPFFPTSNALRPVSYVEEVVRTRF